MSQSIRYAIGNILSAPERVIIHGCNAQGRFGKGVAKAIRDKFPWAFDAYDRTFNASGLTLGSVIWATDGKTVVGNCVAQQYYGNDGNRYVSYEALRTCLKAVNEASFAGIPDSPFANGFDRVAMPLIGTGLAGGDWDEIETIISETLKDVQSVVYVLPGDEFEAMARKRMDRQADFGFDKAAR